MLSLRYMLRELLAEKTRIILTVLAIAWGTFSISSMLAVGEGLRVVFGQAMAGAGKSILAIQGGQSSKAFKGMASNQMVYLTEEDLQAIRKGIPDIQITPEYVFSANYQYQQNRTSMMGSAVYPIYGTMRSLNVAANGRFINPLDIQQARRIVVLGNHLAQELFTDGSDPVGKIVYINQLPFLVVGVLKPKIQTWSYNMPPDDYLAWIPATTYIAAAHPTAIDNLIIIANNPKMTDIIQRQIQQLIAYNHQLNPNDEEIINIQSAYDVQQKTQTLFGGMEIFLGIIGGLTLIVAGAGIANVMFASVKRATSEIGIRMAIGAMPYQVLWHYIIEALFATLIGGLIGLAVTKGLIMLINLVPIHSKIFQFTGTPRPILSSLVVVIVIITLGAIGLLAGFFPAKTAASIDPARALRHE